MQYDAARCGTSSSLKSRGSSLQSLPGEGNPHGTFSVKNGIPVGEQIDGILFILNICIVVLGSCQGCDSARAQDAVRKRPAGLDSMTMMLYTHTRLFRAVLARSIHMFSEVVMDAVDDRFVRTVRVPRRDVADGAMVPVMESPWPGFEPDPLYPVTVFAKVAHDGRNLNVLYHVVEPELRRMCTNHNGDVWTDSCVEVFLLNPAISGNAYVNFEFSASTYALAGRGTGRTGRELYPVEQVAALPVEFHLLRNTATFEGMSCGSEWTLSVSLPLARFGLAPADSDIGGLRLKGNFYKCGDGLDRPHYLMWNPIDTARPEFHSPACFGFIELEP